MKNYLLCFFLVAIYSCSQPQKSDESKEDVFQKYTPEQEQIIEEFANQCAHRHMYTFEMSAWQECLDRGLEKDSTISYLWQQKAMPYFKARKYEAGMVFLNKAVQYNKRKYLAYRGFIKCIFSKTYREAILDFENAIVMEGNNYEMDHTYKFYIALSHLQLNEFEKAEKIFSEDIADQDNKFKDGAHFLDLFYFGISKYELGKWEEAIQQFDRALVAYPSFAEVLLYKAICLHRLGKLEEAEEFIIRAKKEGKNGNTINEDNAIYEKYPYQYEFNRHAD